MRLFALGDPHLPSTRGKEMQRFGWVDHPRPLMEAWDRTVTADDAIIVAGDISWATRPSEVLEDLAWLDARPGKKVLLKGNHDYWWGDSSAKLRKLFKPYGSFVGFIHNCAVEVGPYLIAGSRLWTTPEAPPLPSGELGDVPPKPDYIERETRRLALSIDDAREREAARSLSRASPSWGEGREREPLGGEGLHEGEAPGARGPVRVCATHFPPLYANALETAFSRLIEAWRPEVSVYGHLHGPGVAAGFVGPRNGTRYVLASCDAAGFAPVQLFPSGLPRP